MVLLPPPPCRHHPQIKRFLSAVLSLPGPLFPLRKRLPSSFSTKPLPGTRFQHPENFPARPLPLTSASAPGTGKHPHPVPSSPVAQPLCLGTYLGLQQHIWVPKCTSGCPNAHLLGQADPTSLSSMFHVSQLGGRGRAPTHECDSRTGCSVSPVGVGGTPCLCHLGCLCQCHRGACGLSAVTVLHPHSQRVPVRGAALKATQRDMVSPRLRPCRVTQHFQDTQWP